MSNQNNENTQGRREFTLMGGDVRVWIDQDSIHLVAFDHPYRDPVELTAGMARELASELQKMADKIDE